MPARRSKEPSGCDGDGAAAGEVTNEPKAGRLEVRGGEVTFLIRTPFEPMRERTHSEIGKRLIKVPDDRASEDRAFVDRNWQHIDSALRALRLIEDSATREALENGLGAALALGFFHRGGPALAKESAQKAHEASRRSQSISDVLEQNVLLFKERKPNFQGTYYAIARSIWRSVAVSLAELPEAPKRWERYWREDLAKLPTTDKLVKQFLDSLRNAIKQMDE